MAALSGERIRHTVVFDLRHAPGSTEEAGFLAAAEELGAIPGVEAFEVLRKTEPGRGDEIQLTDALRTLAGSAEDGPVHGVVFTGRRYDTGDRLEYLKTVVTMASERADLGPDFRRWLLEFVDKSTREAGRSAR